MSSRFVLEIKVEGNALKVLENLQKNGISGAMGRLQTVGGSASGGGIWGKLESIGLTQIAKLAGISLGIGTIAHAMTKSSGILQGTFKLMEQTFMLALKPMADFFGLVLRPVAVAILTQMVVPFYKYVYPWFRDAGKAFGEFLKGGWFPTGGGLIADLSFDNLQVSFDAAGKDLSLVWDRFFATVTMTLNNVPTVLWQTFIGLNDQLWQWLSNVPTIIWQAFVGLGDQLWQWFADIPNILYQVFTGLADNIVAALANVPQIIKEAIVSWVESSNPAGAAGSPGLMGGAGIATRMQALADTLD